MTYTHCPLLDLESRKVKKKTKTHLAALSFAACAVPKVWQTLFLLYQKKQSASQGLSHPPVCLSCLLTFVPPEDSNNLILQNNTL